MEEKILNEKESLELITKMIRNTQNKIIQNQGTPFLIWGYGVALTAIAVWLTVTLTGNMMWNFLWFAPSAVCYPLMYRFTRRQNKTANITTYVDKIVSYVWTIFGIAEGIATVTMFIDGFVLKTDFPIFYVSMLLMGSAITLTGLVIKFRPILYGGIAAFVMSFGFLFTESITDVYLMFAISFVATMIIPGHILNHKAEKPCCGN